MNIDEIKKEENAQHVLELLSKAKKIKIPLTCVMEITSKCNFRCVHCYLDGIHDQELSLKECLDYINQIKNLGGRFLTLTGGEPLLHPHFKEIYTYAYSKGLLIDVFTNGSLIDDNILDLFRTLPPRVIEVSLYGFDINTFMNVTRTNYDLKKILSNIKKIQANGLNVILKNIVLKNNVSDFFKIKNWAFKEGINFKYDFNIFPTIQNNEAPTNFALTTNEIIQLEIAEGKTDQWIKQYKNREWFSKERCGCGRISYMISSASMVRKCNFLVDSNECFSLKNNTLEDIWELLKKQETKNDEECQMCEYKALCDICPAMSYAMNENRKGKVKKQCELAKKDGRL